MQPGCPHCTKLFQAVNMKKAVSFLAVAVLAVSLVMVSACSDKAASVLAPQAAASEMTLVSSDQNTVVAMSEGDMVDSLYNEWISRYESSGKEYDPEQIRHIAEFQARALTGTEIYLSEYEVEALPAEMNPEYGYMTLTTPNGTFYFLIPHCICGHVMYEERYFPDNDFQMLTCGCTETLL
jgi:hypothetical protein